LIIEDNIWEIFWVGC